MRVRLPRGLVTWWTGSDPITRLEALRLLLREEKEEEKKAPRVVPFYPRSEDRIYREKTATRCAR